jgi:hypothetical protein
MSAEEYTNPEGWTRGCYHHKPGFTKLLWQILQDKGFHDPPIYFWKKEDTSQKVACTAYVHIPESENHKDWDLEEARVQGFEFTDTIEDAALTALTELCEKISWRWETALLSIFLFNIKKMTYGGVV